MYDTELSKMRFLLQKKTAEAAQGCLQRARWLSVPCKAERLQQELQRQGQDGQAPVQAPRLFHSVQQGSRVLARLLKMIKIRDRGRQVTWHELTN